jgi:outer membrane immunogenic protein
MRHIGAIGALAGATLLASSAFAADIYVEPAPVYEPIAAVPAAFNWTGFYAGVQGGWSWANVSRTVGSSSWQTDGAVLGGHVGYDYQWNWLVLGLEGDFEWWDIDGDDGGVSGVVDDVDGNWLASIRARAGVAWNRFLIYATGGWQWGDGNINQTITGTSGPTIQNGFDFDTWTVGGGVEFAVWNNLILGLEYRYIDSFSVSTSINAVSIADTYNFDDIHTVRGRLRWKF